MANNGKQPCYSTVVTQVTELDKKIAKCDEENTHFNDLNLRNSF